MSDRLLVLRLDPVIVNVCVLVCSICPQPCACIVFTDNMNNIYGLIRICVGISLYLYLDVSVRLVDWFQRYSKS